MHEFTLVIPTYNRPRTLAAFLSYLEAGRAKFRVLILDSSEPKSRAINKTRTLLSKLDVERIDFPNEIAPFDKFREGIHAVATPFCALCADDDIVIIDGIRRSLHALRSNPKASVAQGYSFSFLPRTEGTDISNILYFAPTIADDTPLARLAKLFDQYQAATYGTYRTNVLQRIFDRQRPVDSILGRELLGSALAVLEGEMIRLPCFSHGRSMDASERYEHWHPLEWFAKDPQDLFREYQIYRDIIVKAALDRPDNTHDASDVTRIVDLVHLRYFIKHAPESALGFITKQESNEVPFAQYWPSGEIQLPLIQAAGIGSSIPNAAQRWSGELKSLQATMSGSRDAPIGVVNRLSTYRLHPGFVAPAGATAPTVEAIDTLLKNLDNYQLERDSRTTVSVLLCNYNHSLYLPQSLRAICEQSRQPDEVIVLDDGSTDDSVNIIEDFARRYPFVRVLKNDKNRGLLYSINRILAEARSEFVVWAAADDILLPTFLGRSLSALARYPNAEIVFSQLATFKDGSDEIVSFTKHNHGKAFDFGEAPQFWLPPALRMRLSKSYLWLSANTVLARRKRLLEWGGFDQELHWHADYFAFWVLALRCGACAIPETLAAMRERQQTYSSAGMANRVEQIAVLGRMLDKIGSGPWRDIGLAVMRCPSLLSPFGALVLSAAWQRPRRWPFAVTYGLWLAIYRLSSRNDRMKLHWRLLATALLSINRLAQGCLSQAEKGYRLLWKSAPPN